MSNFNEKRALSAFFIFLIRRCAKQVRFDLMQISQSGSVIAGLCPKPPPIQRPPPEPQRALY
ncbi:protein of unknown function [Methylocaldum szegediense]|uniref:Uncharacterized protein n=1 Tax=Methylocaldum szegediense TaxID=73780 RepID=A0ABN8XA51_9GAMM|nr:protein of unknown function [Methylocaldum szegediense]